LFGFVLFCFYKKKLDDHMWCNQMTDACVYRKTITCHAIKWHQITHACVYRNLLSCNEFSNFVLFCFVLFCFVLFCFYKKKLDDHMSCNQMTHVYRKLVCTEIFCRVTKFHVMFHHVPKFRNFAEGVPLYSFEWH